MKMWRLVLVLLLTVVEYGSAASPKMVPVEKKTVSEPSEPACPLEVSVQVTSPVEAVAPGDTVHIQYVLKNVSKQLVVLARDCHVVTFWKAEPEMLPSPDPNPAAHTKSKLFTPGAGSGGMTFGYPAWEWPPNADEFAFLEPGNIVRHDSSFTVPAHLAQFPFTSLCYHAVFYSLDNGQKYGLKAWTGKINVQGFTLKLPLKPAAD